VYGTRCRKKGKPNLPKEQWKKTDRTPGGSKGKRNKKEKKSTKTTGGGEIKIYYYLGTTASTEGKKIHVEEKGKPALAEHRRQ